MNVPFILLGWSCASVIGAAALCTCIHFSKCSQQRLFSQIASCSSFHAPEVRHD